MTDEEIRAALLDARGAFAPYSVSDHVVVSRDRVAGDLKEIDRWVRDHKGWIDAQPGYESRSLSAGRWQRQPSTPQSLWYVVPTSALRL